MFPHGIAFREVAKAVRFATFFYVSLSLLDCVLLRKALTTREKPIESCSNAAVVHTKLFTWSKWSMIRTVNKQKKIGSICPQDATYFRQPNHFHAKHSKGFVQRRQRTENVCVCFYVVYTIIRFGLSTSFIWRLLRWKSAANKISTQIKRRRWRIRRKKKR